MTLDIGEMGPSGGGNNAAEANHPGQVRASVKYAGEANAAGGQCGEKQKGGGGTQAASSGDSDEDSDGDDDEDEMTVEVREIVCKIGNKEYSFPLKDA